MCRRLPTFEEFVEIARKVQEIEYDYSLVDIVAANTKIKIICPRHGLFEQPYNCHLRGSECPGCSRDRRKTTKEQFIKLSQEILGEDVTGYDTMDFRGMHEKVRLICNKPGHGPFEKVPTDIIYHKQGCPKCGIGRRNLNTKLTKEEYINRSKDVHGEDTFNYDLIEYISCDTKVKLICNKEDSHGIFEITPYHNLTGGGCPKCVGKNLTREEHINEFRKVHGDKYDYSLFAYITNSTPGIIICNKPGHGEFLMSPTNHRYGKQECPKCHGKNLTTEDIINEFRKVHGDRYDYSKFIYKGCWTPSLIICRKHGEFLQNPTHHKAGENCPRCFDSKGERTIRDWFIKNNIEFKQQYSYSDLKGVKKIKSRILKFDFYIPFMNLLIEYDGEQHFEPITFGRISEERAIENFKKAQHNDTLKNEYCAKNNIPLLRINYKDFKKIPKILSKHLSNSLFEEVIT